MNKGERIVIIKQIDDWIDNNCKKCVYWGKDNKEQQCKKCSVHAELLQLGEQLEGEKKMSKLELTVENFKNMKAKGLTDKEIAKEVRKSLATLYNFKKKHGLMERTEYKAPTDDKLQQKVADLKSKNADLIQQNDKLQHELEESKKRIDDMYKNVGKLVIEKGLLI